MRPRRSPRGAGTGGRRAECRRNACAGHSSTPAMARQATPHGWRVCLGGRRTKKGTPAAGSGVRGGAPRRVVTPLEETCFQAEPESAICVQSFDDSLNSAIRTTYRISLRSSSLREPRYPSVGVVCFWLVQAERRAHPPERRAAAAALLRGGARGASEDAHARRGERCGPLPRHGARARSARTPRGVEGGWGPPRGPRGTPLRAAAGPRAGEAP